MESNWLFKKLLVVIIAAFLFFCGNDVVSAQSRVSFRPPEIPLTIVDIDARREYLALHYWDNFNIEDTELVNDNSLMNFAMSGYVSVLMMSPSVIVEKSIDVILSRALKCGYTQYESLTSQLEEWLYNPNSPMRNEELYIYVLRHTIEVAELEDIYKIRPRYQLEMVLKNRIGEVATDFRCKNIAGESSTLHQISTPSTILFFNTPDCNDCRRVKEYIASSLSLSRLVDAQKLTILGVYTEGDKELWLKTKYPSLVVNTNDSDCEIVKNKLYDLKALPTLYLLDINKKVILKDRSIEEIEEYLNHF